MKAKFSELLDTAASEGPQLICRRKDVFVVTTEFTIETACGSTRRATNKVISAWDAMSMPPDGRLTEEEYAELSSALQRH